MHHRRAFVAALGLTLLIVAAAPLAGAQSGAAQDVHVVVPGDTLYALALRFDTTVGDLASANHLSSTVLRVGTRLLVPAAPKVVGYRTVTAAAHDTLDALAERFGLLPSSLRSANPGLPATGDLDGALVLVPPSDGVTVIIEPGDTLLGLSLAAGASPGDVVALNGLGADLALEPGTPLLLPAQPTAAHGSVPAATPAPAVGVSGPGTVPGSSQPQSLLAVARAPEAATGVADPRSRLRAMQAQALRAGLARLGRVRLDTDTFTAPLTGRITSRFGWRTLSVNGNHVHYGVDVAAAAGTAVLAARDGVVTKASWGGSYGNVIYLDHGDGSQTRYAHLSSIGVVVGQAVRQGDPIGTVGSTGAATGPHLHFELRFDGRAVDPLAYVDLRGS